MNNGIKICKRCLTLSTRPRVRFNKDGVCNACVWADKKQNNVDWAGRWNELVKICDRFRREDGYWDVLVPCSGGKDGSYVAWMLKHKLHMNPLCVTLSPQMPTRIGEVNLSNFVNSGFDHIKITPDPEVYKYFAKIGFVEQGRPKLPFVMGISTVTMKIALKMGIPFIMYGEEGEEEYGGETSQIGKYEITRDYLIDYYYSGHSPDEYRVNFSNSELNWWTLPEDDEITRGGLFPTHWSHFENWDPEVHYQIAKKYCGLQTLNGFSIGTFNGYAQLDDKLQDLHAYMMYIKFGFGRCWSDACIEIRASRITREQGIQLVKKYDGVFPDVYLKEYLDYFDMDYVKFWKTVDSFRSPQVWKKNNGIWRLRFEIQ